MQRSPLAGAARRRSPLTRPMATEYPVPSDAELRSKLNASEFHILREAGTERFGAGKYNKVFPEDRLLCVAALPPTCCTRSASSSRTPVGLPSTSASSRATRPTSCCAARSTTPRRRAPTAALTLGHVLPRRAPHRDERAPLESTAAVSSTSTWQCPRRSRARPRCPSLRSGSPTCSRGAIIGQRKDFQGRGTWARR